MTNFEKITKDMKELARFIEDFGDNARFHHSQCIKCPARDICHDYSDCEDAFVTWLNSESK